MCPNSQFYLGMGYNPSRNTTQTTNSKSRIFSSPKTFYHSQKVLKGIAWGTYIPSPHLMPLASHSWHLWCLIQWSPPNFLLTALAHCSVTFNLKLRNFTTVLQNSKYIKWFVVLWNSYERSNCVFSDVKFIVFSCFVCCLSKCYSLFLLYCNYLFMYIVIIVFSAF